jgi:plasmid stability protein
VASLTVRNIPEDAKLRFRQIAAAHGRSMEEHLRQLVIDAGDISAPQEPIVREQRVAYRAEPQASENWVSELIRLANGADLRIPESRSFVRYAPDYPDGMAPEPDENFIAHISRISRPGIDLDAERDRTPHEGPEF